MKVVITVLTVSMDFVKMAFIHWQAPLSENLQIDTRWEVFGNQ